MEIATLNNLSDPNKININQTLKIPLGDPSAVEEVDLSIEETTDTVVRRRNYF